MYPEPLVAPMRQELTRLGFEELRTGAGARQTRYLPMQARVGDYALFFRKAAVEITVENDRFLVVPQAAILALVREPGEREEGEDDYLT